MLGTEPGGLLSIKIVKVNRIGQLVVPLSLFIPLYP